MNADIVLPAELTIFAAAALHARWLGQLAARTGPLPGDFPIAADAVTDVDAAGLQLLVALCASVSARGGRPGLVAPSERLREALAGCGLQLPIAPPASGTETQR